MLELRKIQIRDIVISDRDRIEDGILYFNPESLAQVIKEDKRIKKVSFDIARPGESVRIVPVKDVIEPRAKVEGETFGGTFGEQMDELGRGITYVLSGCALVSTGPIVGFQEGIIDMSGPGAQYSIFSKLNNIVMVIEKENNVSPMTMKKQFARQE